jgi:hypothetical protein
MKLLTSRYFLTPAVYELKLLAARTLSGLVSLDHATGTLTWLPRKTGAPRESAWNSRYAGKDCGSMAEDGYRVLNLKINGKTVNMPAHRLVWFISTGQLPEHDLDHINGDRQDNRMENLREVHRSVNCKNAAMRKDNKSGVSGVHFDGKSERWVAMCRVNGKRHNLGRFTSIEEAANVRRAFMAGKGFTERHGM